MLRCHFPLTQRISEDALTSSCLVPQPIWWFHVQERKDTLWCPPTEPFLPKGHRCKHYEASPLVWNNFPCKGRPVIWTRMNKQHRYVYRSIRRCSPVPELSFFPAPYIGAEPGFSPYIWGGEKRKVQELHYTRVIQEGRVHQLICSWLLVDQTSYLHDTTDNV